MNMKLSNLKRMKTSGPDNLPSWDLKEFAMELSAVVANIFNASIQERAAAASWKEADAIPIQKTDKVKEIEIDLSPISLTSILSKLWNTSSLIGLRHRLDTSLTGSNSDHSLAYPQLMLYYLSFTISITL